MKAEKNNMLKEICTGLSEVCMILSEQKQEEEIVINEKMKIMKKQNPDDMNLQVIKALMKKKKENYKKFSDQFKKKAKIFKALAKLYKVNSMGGKNGKETRKNKI